MQRRTLLQTLPALALVPSFLRPARAAARFALGPRPPVGARYAIDLERVREVYDAGAWVVEARARARARLEVEDAGRLRWRWTRYGAEEPEADAGRPPDPLRLRMARLWEDVAFAFQVDGTGRLQGLADAAAARRQLEQALDAALADVADALVREGRPREQVTAALTELRRRFLAPYGDEGALARGLLLEPAVLFELGGLSMAPGEESERVEPRPLDFAPGRRQAMRVRDHFVWYDEAEGSGLIRRIEEPAEPLDRTLLLDRVPGLAAMWRALPEEKRAEVLAALPKTRYRRTSRLLVPLAGDRLPREVVRVEQSGLGTLMRRLRLELRLRRLET